MKNIIILVGILSLFGLLGCEKEYDLVLPYDSVGTGEILVKQDSCYCFVPNVFSPDGNSINDLLRPRTWRVLSSDYLFTVHDAKGIQVFTSTTLGESWSATNQPAGLYFISVKGTFVCGNSFEEETRVLLIRNCIPKSLDVNRLFFESMFDPISAMPLFPAREIICP